MKQIKVLTLNLRHNSDRWPERIPLVVDTLKGQSPDVIGLQEVWLSMQQAELIVNQLNAGTDRPYSVFTASKWGEELVEGIAMVSRLPVVAYEHTNLPLTSRIAQRLRVMVDDQPVDIVNTHLHNHPECDESIRLPQMEHILHWMFEREGDCRWILMGDMNAQPGSSTIQAAARHFKSVLPTGVVTFPAPLRAREYPAGSDIQIDHILYCESRLQLLNGAVVAQQTHPDDPTLSASDHYGIVAEFALGL
jgi:endonuclease/exonuclease/phosphatase family metal-dependent hydrolase